MFKIIKFIFKKYKFKLYLKQWRKINSHNSTYPTNFYPSNLISVGRKSYGPLNVKFFGNIEEKLEIGNFVSIAEEVTFITGGNHNTSVFTNFPLMSVYLQTTPEYDALTKGSIIIEDEVWIGYGATILSGVRIGKGAIIGAKSVVTKDVEPYVLVAGNPARKIKNIFSNEQISSLLRVNLNDLDDRIIQENIEKFYQSSEEVFLLFKD